MDEPMASIGAFSLSAATFPRDTSRQQGWHPTSGSPCSLHALYLSDVIPVLAAVSRQEMGIPLRVALVFSSGPCTHSAGLLLLGIYYPILFTLFVTEEKHRAEAVFVLFFLNDASSQAMLTSLQKRRAERLMHLDILLFRAGRIDQMIMLMSVCYNLTFDWIWMMAWV
jgi:hypothetical protein